jgi:hypothetical protein
MSRWIFCWRRVVACGYTGIVLIFRTSDLSSQPNVKLVQVAFRETRHRINLDASNAATKRQHLGPLFSISMLLMDAITTVVGAF